MGIGGGGGGFSFQKGEEKEKKNITFIRVPSLDRRATVTYMYRWGSGGMMFSTCGNASSPPPPTTYRQTIPHIIWFHF